MAIATLAENPFDIPFALLYRLNDDCTEAILQEQTIDIKPIPALQSIDLTSANLVWPLAVVLERQTASEVDNLRQFGDWAAGALNLPIERAIVLPLWASGQDELVGMLVAGVNPARELDLDYRNFFEITAGHIETAIANATTCETERQRAEALAELDRAKTTFFSNIWHEFRTPLTLMLNSLEDRLAIETIPQRDTIELIHRNSLRLLKLVNTLLDFFRLEAGRIEAIYQPTDLARLTQELASNFRSAIERADMYLTIGCPPLDELAYVDRDMWEKIVLNLLSNASKFTFEGGITVRLQAAGESIELTLQDMGVGISQAELPHLFDRLHRASETRSRTYEGSGIGLALVQELVRLHCGSIAVQSAIGQGTTFTIAIPTGIAHLPPDRVQIDRSLPSSSIRVASFVEEALRWLPETDFGLEIRDFRLEETRENNSTSKISTPKSKILLADDNADMRDYVQRLLSEFYEVEAVVDGEAALQI